MAEGVFFPPREARDLRQVVIDRFPFPLALTYARLHAEMDRQEPVGAAWQMRDAFECVSGSTIEKWSRW
jgi:hypothetical protein